MWTEGIALVVSIGNGTIDSIINKIKESKKHWKKFYIECKMFLVELTFSLWL